MPNLNLWHSTPDYYSSVGGGNTAQAYVKEVSPRIERSAKQTRIILSMLHNETLHWIAERVAAEHKRTNHLPR